MSSYDWILFDADGTLFDFDRAEKNALCLSLQEVGEACDDTLYQRYHHINQQLWLQLERGEVTRQELQNTRFTRLFAELGKKIDGKQMNDWYRKYLGEGCFLMEEAEEVCLTLAQQCRMAIITNGNAAVQKSRFSRSTLRPYFLHLFISEELGCDKPRKEFFEKVLHTIQPAARERVLVVGDSLTSDIQGGNNAGLDTCWLNWTRTNNSTTAVPTYEINTLKELYPLVLG